MWNSVRLLYESFAQFLYFLLGYCLLPRCGVLRGVVGCLVFVLVLSSQSLHGVGDDVNGAPLLPSDAAHMKVAQA